MTESEFEQILKDSYKFKNRLNSITAIVLLVGGITFLLYLIANGVSIDSTIRHEIIIGKLGILILPFLPIIDGILILHFLPKQYKVSKLLSTKPLNQKEESFYESLPNLKVLGAESNDKYHTIYCRNKLYSRFAIHLYLDNEKYLFNVLSHDHGGRGGVYDFGMSKRISKKIMASLQQRV